jgi:pimeloyl-ACP methyl ester carboxylesterase
MLHLSPSHDVPALCALLCLFATGNGFSDKPSWFSGGAQWSVDTHLQSDAPAVLDYVLEATGHSQVHWIGHSMGGMIACGLISSRSPHAAALASITTLASGCFGAGSWHAWARGLINAITSGWGFPAGGACKLMSMLTGTPLSLACLETLFFWRSNMPVALQRKLLASCFSYIPTGVIQQFMGSLNTPQGITATDGKFRYADPEALSQCTTPIMGLTGDWDLFCPAAGGYKTINAFGSAAKKFVFLGPGYGTTQEHYGHFDVVAGSRVMEEVYPHITQWLQQVEGL